MLMKQFKEELTQGATSAQIPKELIELFNSELPSKLKYIPHGDDLLLVDHKVMKAKCYILEKENEKWLNKYKEYITDPLDAIEIMTLTQTQLAIGISDTMECDGIEIPSELYIRSIKDTDVSQKIVRYILPNELPSYNFVLSIANTEVKISTQMKLQKCDDIEYQTFNNFHENNSLKLSFTSPSRFYRGNTPKKLQISFYVDKANAHDVENAVKSYKLYEAFLTDKLLINNTLLSPDEVSDKRKEEMLKGIQINFKLLHAMQKLEEKINIKFTLTEDIDEETIDVIMKLYISLVRNKAYGEKMSLKNMSFIKEIDDEKKINDTIGKPSAFIISGPLSANILGNQIDLHYATCYFHIKLTGVEKLEDNKYKFIFDCTDEKYHATTKIYLSEEQMIDESTKNFNEYFDDTIELGNIETIVSDE